MAWGATATDIDMKAYKVSLHFAEDMTGEALDEIIDIPRAPEPNWLPEYVGNRIVELTRRTAVIQSIVIGYVTPSQDVLDAAQVTATPDSNIKPLPPDPNPVQAVQP